MEFAKISNDVYLLDVSEFISLKVYIVLIISF